MIQSYFQSTYDEMELHTNFYLKVRDPVNI